ncbi:MAG TPA: amidohydrolase family protein [Ramlibacter sp.]|uniref:amidohydrolase family protein n=1 Tax=Ramlibacter sp. TaxID=1917967 RepID=UPI002D060EE5|nr:amidohydrolase family protein [Ramlibacter sp.]HVZ45809.1 amidohydrolase family protein [Ramlibacter sp.]
MTAKPATHRAIDVHTHVVPGRFPAYTGRTARDLWPSMADAPNCHRHVMLKGSIYRTVPHSCWDCAARAADMPAMQVGRQVLSPMPELLSYWLPADDGQAMCRFLNETIAEFTASDPTRFTGLGAVPLQDVDAAIAELHHAIDALHLAGVEIGTNINGTVIGDASFEPFFAAAEALGAAVFVHPLRPSGLDRVVGPAMLEQVLAFPGETGLAAASLITGGTLARHPRLRIAFSHGGGSLQALLPRLQHGWHAFSKLREAVAQEPAAAARTMFYDSLVYDAAALKRVVDVFGDTQVMVGSDYPFAILDKDPTAGIRALDCDDAARERLLWRNASRWLGKADE